jgi:Zn/Cd-binding protein ZinT
MGANVDPAAAIEVMKLAVTQWPHLKYIHLSTDGGSPPDESHYEIYLGGATSTALDYELKEWAATEIAELSEKMTTKDFHSAVRAKYS